MIGKNLLSFQYSDFTDVVDLQIIAAHCLNLKHLGVNAAAVVLSSKISSHSPDSSAVHSYDESGTAKNCKDNYLSFFPVLKGNVYIYIYIYIYKTPQT